MPFRDSWALTGAASDRLGSTVRRFPGLGTILALVLEDDCFWLTP